MGSRQWVRGKERRSEETEGLEKGRGQKNAKSILGHWQSVDDWRGSEGLTNCTVGFN